MRFIIIFCIPMCIQAQIIINEFMPYPHAGNPEWIELHNPDSIHSFTSDFLWIEDANSRSRIEDVIIPPLGYIVICRDTGLLQNTIGLINCPMIQSSLPTLNNTGDKIKIRNHDSILIDSITYVFKKEFRGKSLERFGNAFHMDSLAISLNPKGNTCGYINACNPQDDDLVISSIDGDNDAIVIMLHNNGNTILHDITISIVSDNSLIQEQIPSLAINAYQKIRISLGDMHISHGMNHLVIQSMHAFDDPRIYNNNGQYSWYQSFPKRSIIINEMNVTEHVFPEYIELRIMDKQLMLSEGYACIIGKDTIDIAMEESSEYILLTKELSAQISSLVPMIFVQGLSISNAGTTITIIDPNGIVIDSVNYTPFIDQFSSYIPTHSLEYIDSLNGGAWFVSTHEQGGTPGFSNSRIIALQKRESDFRLKKCHNQYTNCHEIQIEHPFTIGVYSCDVYTLDGLFITSIIKDKLISGESICSIPESSELSSSVYLLLHTVRNFHGSEILEGITPFIKRK